jgi:excisionase family DNA binding protein
MEKQNTIESLLCEFLTPIVENAIENVLIRNKFLFQQLVSTQTAPELWDIKKAFEYIHLTVPTIYGHVRRSTIPNYKKGKRFYFKKEDLDKWIGEGRRLTIKEIGDSIQDYFPPRRRLK